jgi:integrase
MYACGLRISEAATLEIGAIDRANHVLRIIGKGNKERLAPLPQPVLDALGRLWLTHHNPRWLFPKPDKPEPKGKDSPSAVRANLDDPPIHIRPIVPAFSGCKAKEPFGSGHYGT